MALLDRHNEAQRRLDWRAGMQAATVANALGGKKKRRAFRPEDFMPKELKTQPWEDQLAVARAYTEGWN